MQYSLSDLVDLPTLQRMMENLWNAAGLPGGILDVDGRVLIAAGRQDICTSFHRKHPRTELLCRQSDAFIQDHFGGRRALPDCGYVECRCKNGMIDIAVPIAIEGRQLATLFLGQFFYEAPDRDFFRQQARQYGFDEDSYLKALAEVPIFTRQKVEEILSFHMQFVNMVSSNGLQKLRHLETLGELEYREAFEALIAGISTRFVGLSPADADEGIDSALRKLGEFAGVERSYVILSSAGGEGSGCSNEWCAEGVESRKRKRQGLTFEDFPWSSEKILGREVLHIPRLSEMPLEAAAEREVLENAGVRSLLAVPVLTAGKVAGVLGFETVHREKFWSEKDLTLLKTVGEIIGNAIERKRSEARLKESEERFALALQVSNEGVWDWDLKTGNVFLSPRYFAMLGYEADEYPGSFLSWEKLLHPEDRDGAIAAAKEHSLKGGKGGAEFRLLAKSGEYLHILSRGQVVATDGEGNPTRMVGTHMDITERKEAEEALRGSEKKFRRLSQEFQALLDGIPDNLVLLSPELEIVWVNKAAADYAGRGADFSVGKTCYSLRHNRTRPCDICPVVRAFVSGEVEESMVAVADGTKWELKALPLKDKEGKVVNVIELATDITEKSRLRQKAEKASRLASLGELAAGMAHEINNPNALIGINSSLLAKGVPDILPILEGHYREHGDFRIGELDYSDLREELPDLFSEMREASQRIKRIVEDLKDFASPAGYGRTEAIDLNAALEAALRLCGPSIKKWTDHFAVDYGEALPRVSGDFQGVVQVAVNLVVNACQALAEKERGVLVSTFFEKDRNRVVLQVRDQGVGIAEKDMPHITDPFFTTRREDGGTGLGLSVSARIVKEMGASLSFDSRPGEGTTAILSMPPLHEEISR